MIHLIFCDYRYRNNSDQSLVPCNTCSWLIRRPYIFAICAMRFAAREPNMVPMQPNAISRFGSLASSKLKLNFYHYTIWCNSVRTWQKKIFFLSKFSITNKFEFCHLLDQLRCQESSERFSLMRRNEIASTRENINQTVEYVADGRVERAPLQLLQNEQLHAIHVALRVLIAGRL